MSPKRLTMPIVNTNRNAAEPEALTVLSFISVCSCCLSNQERAARSAGLTVRTRLDNASFLERGSQALHQRVDVAEHIIDRFGGDGPFDAMLTQSGPGGGKL